MRTPALALVCCCLATTETRAQKTDLAPSPVSSAQPGILTPPAAHTPAIHGPTIFGVRPGSPFLYTIPATGDRPLHFGACNLPAGLQLDANTGRITGTLQAPGTSVVTLTAENRLGKTQRRFTIRVGDEISLTPPMGWNSYNVWGAKVTAEEVMAAARAMIDSGLSQHGFTYINIDDGWQGLRGGPLNAVQPDPEAFSDFAAMTARIHAMGLKVGIYHTPWVTSYGRRIGASSENATGLWSKSMPEGPRNKKILPHAIGKYHFMQQDAQQFAQWGVDYLKYDWAPVEAPETREMQQDLRATGRDIVFSLSNNATNSLLGNIAEVAPNANLWRTNHDIDDSWKTMSRNGFDQDAWAPFARPGHFNDPDMLVLGIVGWGHPHPTRLTQDEQYTHVSLWCLSAAPLILGNKLEDLDEFTRSLLTNDEVLDLDQDSLGKQATVVARSETGAPDTRVYAKALEDGSFALGLFNLSTQEQQISVKWADAGLKGSQRVRDLWKQKDVGEMPTGFTSAVAPHGVRLIRIFPAGSPGGKR